jgi:hypothetical protein
MDATRFVLRQRDLHRYPTLGLVRDHRPPGRDQPAAECPPPPLAHGSPKDRGPAGPVPRQSGPPFPGSWPESAPAYSENLQARGTSVIFPLSALPCAGKMSREHPVQDRLELGRGGELEDELVPLRVRVGGQGSHEAEEPVAVGRATRVFTYQGGKRKDRVARLS